MNTERPYGWMWLRALELADEAERLHRRFLRYIGPGTDAVRWEPPVDIHETADGLILLFALPGVAPEDIEAKFKAIKGASNSQQPPTVWVNADRDVCYNEVARVLGRLHDAGFGTVLNITNEKNGE